MAREYFSASDRQNFHDRGKNSSKQFPTMQNNIAISTDLLKNFYLARAKTVYNIINRFRISGGAVTGREPT